MTIWRTNVTQFTETINWYIIDCCFASGRQYVYSCSSCKHVWEGKMCTKQRWPGRCLCVKATLWIETENIALQRVTPNTLLISKNCNELSFTSREGWILHSRGSNLCPSLRKSCVSNSSRTTKQKKFGMVTRKNCTFFAVRIYLER